VERLVELLPFSYSTSVVLLGAVALGVAAGVLGAFAVLRRRSLVGDALAHAALPGVCVAFLATGTKEPAGLLAGAAAAGLVGAVLMLGIERTGRIRPDAAIGVVLSGFFSLGIVLLTFIAHGEDADQAGLERYLFGQAAGLTVEDVELMALLAGAALLTVAVLFRPLKTTLFDAQFAGSVGLPVRLLELVMTAILVVAVVVGLRTVGAILMVAMLVVPTAAARQLTHRLIVLLPVAALTGALVGATGAVLASRAALPTGPVIVLVGVATVLVCVLLAPGRGVAWRAARLAADRRRARQESVLLELETAMHAGPPPTEEELALLSGRPRRPLAAAVRQLERAGQLRRADGRLVLTEEGAAAAHVALGRRDLLALWLEHGHRVELPDAREPDPRDVRGSLGDDIVARLETYAAEAR
jgi:manganese/zinc/iron transport system permease protein